MLKETERAKGAKGIGPIAVPPEDHNPTLSDLGLTKRESSEAQILADLARDFRRREEMRHGRS